MGRQTAAPGRGGHDRAGPTGAAVLSSLLTRPLAEVCPVPACLSPLWALSLVCCPKHGPHTLLYDPGGGQRPGRRWLGWTPGKSASRASVPLPSVGHVVVTAHSWPGLGWQCPLQSLSSGSAHGHTCLLSLQEQSCQLSHVQAGACAGIGATVPLATRSSVHSGTTAACKHVPCRARPTAEARQAPERHALPRELSVPPNEDTSSGSQAPGPPHSTPRLLGS